LLNETYTFQVAYKCKYLIINMLIATLPDFE
jgi:hypothetical protein